MNEQSEAAQAPSGARHTLVELDEDTCWELLDSTPVGRIGFVTEYDAPMVLPVNHVVHEGTICFRTTSGTKLDFAERRPDAPVVYEVDDYTTDVRSGWSVVVKGRIEPVLDAIRTAHLDRLGHHAWSDDPERQQWVKVVVDEVSGRRIEMEKEPD